MRHLSRHLFRAFDGAGGSWWAPACVERRGDTAPLGESTGVTDVDCPACLVLLDAALASGEVVVREWPVREWPGTDVYGFTRSAVRRVRDAVSTAEVDS